ncbi:bifunctional diaminohydroxyphosphoribosylaminopyrimidine deaminase/5-amino-6-(5-phosphoribosylamino)uracil reductase RibD [Chloroflexota bacterium]
MLLLSPSPCTREIITAGIAEVHAATPDPNDLVSGKGKIELERNGIKVYMGEWEEEARQINEAYIKFVTTGLPFVTAKFAISLDGKIATKGGDSKWISGDEARRHVHYLRYISDAIMVGANTVLVDNPYLTCRLGGVGGRTRKQPLRVIVDGRGRTIPTAQLFSEPGRTLLVTGRLAERGEKEGFIRAGAEVLELPSKEDGIDLKKLLKLLGEREVTSILVEGGGILLGSLFDHKLIDKVITFVAPIIIGGEDAKTGVAGKGVDRVIDSIKLARVSTEKFGEDLMISGYINN